MMTTRICSYHLFKARVGKRRRLRMNKRPIGQDFLFEKEKVRIYVSNTHTHTFRDQTILRVDVGEGVRVSEDEGKGG
jgi:hypothetical protein